MFKTIILVMLSALLAVGLFLSTKRAIKSKNDFVEINRLLDKLEKSQKETLEMLDKRAIR